MKKYTGMVKLTYSNSFGIPTARYVMAFYSTAKELKRDFVPNESPKNVKVTYVK